MDAVHAVKEWWPLLVPTGGAFVASLAALWKAWNSSSDAKRKDRRELIEIAQEAAGAVIEKLRAEIERLDTELAQLRKEHSEMIASKDAEITLLRGELRQKEALIAGYERVMIKAGLKPPKVGDPYWAMHDGKLEPSVRSTEPPPEDSEN